LLISRHMSKHIIQLAWCGVKLEQWPRQELDLQHHHPLPLYQCHHHATKTLKTLQEVHSSKLWSGNFRRKPNLSYMPEGHWFTQIKEVRICDISSQITATLNGLVATMSW